MNVETLEKAFELINSTPFSIEAGAERNFSVQKAFLSPAQNDLFVLNTEPNKRPVK